MKNVTTSQLQQMLHSNNNKFYAIIPDDLEIWEATKHPTTLSLCYTNDGYDYYFHIYCNQEMLIHDFQKNLDEFKGIIFRGIYKYNGFGDDNYFDYLPSQVTSLAYGYYFLAQQIPLETTFMRDIKFKFAFTLNEFLTWDLSPEHNGESDQDTRKTFSSAIDLLDNPSELGFIYSNMPETLILNIFNKTL